MPPAGAAIAAVNSIAAARTSAAAGSSSNSCIPIADSSFSSVATSSVATSSVATSSVAASSVAASSVVDNARTCAVCVARADGTRLPKRKCTCASGLTAGRGTLVQATSVRHEERAVRDPNSIMYPAGSFHDAMDDDEFDEMQEFALKLEDAIKAGNLDRVRALGKRGCKLINDEWTDEMYWADCWRQALSCACEHGHIDAMKYLLDECNASFSALCPHGDPLGPEDEALGLEPMPNPAPPLLIAAESGRTEAVCMLLERGADINASAYDGQTPFFSACWNGQLEMAKLLHQRRADISQADQDGTAPLHAAACRGHLHIMKFLSEIGVDMEARGTVYVGEDWKHMLNDATPVMIARHLGYAEIVKWLQTRNDAPSIPMVVSKRPRSVVPMLERAQNAGVAHRLKVIPNCLHERMQTGTEDEKKAAKKQLQKLQIANQQIVVRAEQVQMRQTTLV